MFRLAVIAQQIYARHVQGLTSAEVCELLELSEANQRVLLHRARKQLEACMAAA